jgi:Iron-containing redox enzyme
MADLMPAGEPGLAAGHAEALRRKTALFLPRLSAAGRALVDHPRVAELYPEYLVAMHGVIRASVPLMETALARARGMEGDPVAAGLADYLVEHIEEERHHDEWLLEDLEVLGIPRATVLSRPPSPTIAALVGAQYYWILHHHPVALMGYIALLEGNPPPPALIGELIERTGFDRAAFRTLVAHGELDPHHRDELEERLDSLPLTPAQSTVLGMSTLFSTHTLALLMEEIVQEGGSPHLRGGLGANS